MEETWDFYIYGFGNQARAWAANLLDNNRTPKIVLRSFESSSYKEALSLGYEVCTETSLPKTSISIALLTPDNTHLEILERLNLSKGSQVVYAHGISVFQNKLDQKFSHISHLLLAPKAIASELRSRCKQRLWIPAAFSLEFSKRTDDYELLCLIKELIGITHWTMSSFEQEFKTDLFSEQTLLCNALPIIIEKSFEYLVSKGIDSKLAYFETLVESKFIVDTLFEQGYSKFFELISPLALVGGHKGSDKVNQFDWNKLFDELWADIDQNHFIEQYEKTNIEDLRTEIKNKYANSSIQNLFEELQNNER